ncbi:MAG TPA: efflux RND transporter periplasmic adaptor subunit [Gemmatimonadales bacterium]|jgi:HlyD family secretion protein|nr:efflux RND transporter periplasmic adaptor subunit [Gemmatimonadales bacterium]
MSRRAKWTLGLAIVVVVGGGLFALTAAKRGNRATEVRLEPVGTRDLVATVTASGKIEAKTKVDISADITGRITEIAVKEGDLVKKGQFLLQIDPAQYESIVSRLLGQVASAEASLAQARTNRDQSKRQRDRALEIQKVNAELIAREVVEQAVQAYDVAEANLNAAQAGVDQSHAALAEARSNLAKTHLVSPIDGRVVRLAVEKGEVAVPGTFSRETGLLMTIADLSIVLAKVQVDETDVVRLELGDSVAVSIDAFPDTAFVGRVTKISNSAKLSQTGASSGSSTDRAVDFDVEVTLDRPPPDIRPDLSATSRVVTDTRKQALSIPIIALTVREHQDVPNETKSGTGQPVGAAVALTAAEKKKKEREGVFVVKNGIATFRPVKVGIAGEEHFEVLDGLKASDTVVAGPYQAVRDLKDSTRVRQVREAKGAGAASAKKAS